MLDNRGLLTLCLFCLVYISWGLTDSIQAPFYPIEATSKGATPTEYGLVFGVIHLAIFVSGPFFGKYMHRLGVRSVYFFGVFVTSFCAIAFGFLDYVDHKASFLGLSYTFRVVEGIAEAASWSAVFAMLLQMYPKNVATIYAMTEASFSFAEMIGPTFGALMYNVGGFILPFEVCGGLCLLTGCLTFFVLPASMERKEEEKERLLQKQQRTLINNNRSKRFSLRSSDVEDNSKLPDDSILVAAPRPNFIKNSAFPDNGEETI